MGQRGRRLQRAQVPGVNLWLWIGGVWLLLSVLTGWALSRWFRFLRGDFD